MWRDLPDDLLGTAEDDGDGWLITLDPRLDRVTRRCVLAHELIHVEREITWGEDGTMEREEVIVDVETARRLVPLDELRSAVVAMMSVGVGVEARHIATHFDVTDEVAGDALRLLAREDRAAA